MLFNDNYGNIYNISKDTILCAREGNIYEETYCKGELYVRVAYTLAHREFKLVEKVRKYAFEDLNIDTFKLVKLEVPLNVFDEWNENIRSIYGQDNAGSDRKKSK